MALHIRNPEADRLARELADRTGESLTEAIIQALKERLEREPERQAPPNMAEDLLEIGRRCAQLPVHDQRTPDEILGYDDDGLPT